MLSFKSAWGSLLCQLGNVEPGGGAPCRVRVRAVASVADLTPKELHHQRKKEEWKRLRRARRLEKLAEQAREQELRAPAPRRRQGLCSFEKYKLAKEKGAVQAPEWKAGVKGKTTLMSKFEQEFALRVRDAVSTISPTSPNSQNPPIFREDSHSIEEDDWLLAYGNDERIHNTSIDHSFGDAAPSRDSSADESRALPAQGDSLGSLQPRDWRVNPKTPRRRDRAVGRRVIDRRKGEPLSTLLDEATDAITGQTRGILEALHQDVTREVWRKPVEEQEQLEWLVQELVQADKKQKFFLSRLMHGARLKWTDGRLLELVKMLGARREWRRAMEVVHWVHSREHFKHCRSRYVCTTLLAVLGKCLRPVEALNVFNVMREEHSTYPDMAAYHSIAVTLGKAGHLTELLHIIRSLKEGPVRRNVGGSPRELNWDGRLEPDIVVYNAVVNACGPHRQWEGTEWVLQQIQSSRLRPNSTTYGLAIEVMVKSRQYEKAWKYYEVMERGGFLPNALTFKALVEALGTTGEVDKAIEMVEEMERRGVLECAGVYYALASALCGVGRLSEALVQVDKLLKLPSRKPDVVTFTGLIRTCDKVGRWQDAMSLFNHMQYVCAPNVGTYNIMIALYGRHRLFEEAREIFELVKKGRHANNRFSQGSPRLSPTEHTYESMLGACAACGDWGYFEVVLEEFHTRGLHLDCRRHAWFISPIVKAGEEGLMHLMVRRLQRPEEPPSADLYRVLLPLLSTHGYHALVLIYLNSILERGVALSTPPWLSIVGKALEQLPMVDAEQFLCTQVAVAEVDDNVLVKELLQCLVSVGAETKARRLVTLLGLEVGEFADATLGDSRLLPQEEEGNISSGVLETTQVEKVAEIQEVYLNDTPSTHNHATVKAIDDEIQFQVQSQDIILQQCDEKVLCGSRQNLGSNSRYG